MGSVVPAEASASAKRRIAPLEAVLLRGELARRPIRRPDLEAENASYLLLGEELRSGPHRVLQSLMDAAIALCGSGTAGLSLLERGPDDVLRFRWTALAGRLAEHINGTVPRDFSPCGVCLDHDAPMLYSHPERRYTFLESAGVPFVEILILPFHVDGRQAGTIWIVAHDESKKFDMEDVRIMTRLARFAGGAYGALGHPLLSLVGSESRL